MLLAQNLSNFFDFQFFYYWKWCKICYDFICLKNIFFLPHLKCAVCCCIILGRFLRHRVCERYDVFRLELAVSTPQLQLLTNRCQATPLAHPRLARHCETCGNIRSRDIWRRRVGGHYSSELIAQRQDGVRILRCCRSPGKEAAQGKYWRDEGGRG